MNSCESNYLLFNIRLFHQIVINGVIIGVLEFLKPSHLEKALTSIVIHIPNSWLYWLL